MTAERTRGYSEWKGERAAHAARWWVIAKGNMSLAWSNRWVKIIALLSLLPGIVAGGIVYFFLPLSSRILMQVLQGGIIFVFLFGALVGARLISEDRKQGAFVAHFARPVRRLDYLAGKVISLALPLFLIATTSAFVALVADLSVDGDTLADRLGSQAARLPGAAGYIAHVDAWNALGSILAFGFLASVTTTGIVLGLSALATKARTAGLAWFAVVALGSAASNILEEALDAQWPAFFSWNRTLSDMAAYILGERTSDIEYMIWPRGLMLLALSVAGLAFVEWRLRRAEGGER